MHVCVYVICMSFIVFETVKDNASCEVSFLFTYSREDYRAIGMMNKF